MPKHYSAQRAKQAIENPSLYFNACSQGLAGLNFALAPLYRPQWSRTNHAEGGWIFFAIHRQL
jgi:hypothetical protein